MNQDNFNNDQFQNNSQINNDVNNMQNFNNTYANQTPIDNTYVNQNTPVDNNIQNTPTTINQYNPVQPNTMTTQTTTTGETPVDNNNNRKSTLPILIIIILLLAIVGGILFFTTKKDNQSSANNNSNDKKETTEIKKEETNKEETKTTDDGTHNTDGTFLMTIDDVFTVTGRGTVVTGTISRGTIKLNDEVQIIGLDHEVKNTIVIGFGKKIDYAEAGDSVGLVLQNVDRDEIEKGQVIAAPNSVKTTKKIEADVHVLSKDEGGRHTPLPNKYNPKFYLNGTVVPMGVITLPNGVESVAPGSDIKVTIDLSKSAVVEVGNEFSMYEGGRTVIKGKVTKVY